MRKNFRRKIEIIFANIFLDSFAGKKSVRNKPFKKSSFRNFGRTHATCAGIKGSYLNDYAYEVFLQKKLYDCYSYTHYCH